MLTSKLSRQLTATLAELDAVRAKSNEYQNKWSNAEEALRREKSKCRQLAEENTQLQDVISALRSLIADKTALLEATRSKLEEEKRVTAALSEDHIRLMEDAYANMSQPSSFKSTSTDSLADTASFYTARSSTPASNMLQSESQSSLGEVSFYSVTSSLRSSPNQQIARPSARYQLFNMVSGRALLAVEMMRNDESGLGFSFACQSISNSDGTIISPQQGVFVKAVREGSIAEQCLMPGDEILELNSMFCRGVPHPVVAMKLKGLQGEVNIVIARPLQSCGLRSPTGHNPALPSSSNTGPPAVVNDVNGNIRDIIQDMLQNFQMQMSEEQRQLREEIAVCNRSVVSVQMAVEDILAVRPEIDTGEVSTPTGSVESLPLTADDTLCEEDGEDGADFQDGVEPGTPKRQKKVSTMSTRSARISSISAPGSGTDRLYDELLRSKQQLSDQLLKNSDLQASMAALRAECSGAVLRARQAESSAEESARALKETQEHNSGQQHAWDSIAKQLADVTGQLTDSTTKLTTAQQEISSKDATVAQLLQQEKQAQTKLEQLQDEMSCIQQELVSSKALLQEREDFINSLQDEQKESSAWQNQARTAQEELFQMRAKLSASESQLSHWQIKEQQLQGQLSRLNDRIKKTENELVDSKETADRFEKQMHEDRAQHQEEVRHLSEQICTAEMENQQLELQLKQRKSGKADKEQQLQSEVENLQQECRVLRATGDDALSTLRQREEELMELRHQLQQSQSECGQIKKDLDKQVIEDRELRSTLSTLQSDKESLDFRVHELQEECNHCHQKLEEQQETLIMTSKQLESAVESHDSGALERSQLEAACDRKSEECAKLQSALLSHKQDIECLQQNLEDMKNSRNKAETVVADLNVHISGLKTLQLEHEKEIDKLRSDLELSREECKAACASQKSASANEVQLKASVETYRSHEAAAQQELESHRAMVKKLEAEVQQEVTRRDVLEKELARLEKSFQSMSEASKSMTSSSADHLKSLEVQLKEERQQLLQSKTECAELQSKLKSNENKVSKQKARIEALQNEAALLQQSSEMLKAACQENESQHRDDKRQVADLQAKLKNAQSSLDAANDVAAQLREIVTGNAEELGELKTTKSRQTSELEKLKVKSGELEQKVKTLNQSNSNLEGEVQRCKHQLVSAESKIATLREAADKAQLADRATSAQREELERRANDLDQRLERSVKAKLGLEKQLEEVMAESAEQVRYLLYDF